MFDFRLVTYWGDEMLSLPGSASPILEDAFDIKFTTPVNDTPVLQMKLKILSTHAEPGAERIDLQRARSLLSGWDVAVEVNDNGSWREPLNCRFSVVSDEIRLAGDAVAITAVGAGSYDLTGVVNLDPATLGKDGKRAFGSVSPGHYLKTMIDDGHGEGLATLLSTKFSGVNDSAGVAWKKRVQMSLAPGVTARQCLDSLTFQGLCEWAFQGNVLHMYNPGTALRRDLSGKVELIAGAAVSGGVDRRTREGVLHKVLVQGEGSLHVKRERLASHPRGMRAGVNQQGGVSQVGTATQLADAILDSSRVIRGEVLRELDLSVGPRPFLDYRIGDVVTVTGEGWLPEKLRVLAITIEKQGDGVKGSVTLADRLIEQELQRSRRINGILGGSTISGGSGAVPNSPSEPTPPPKPPTPGGLRVETSLLEDGGLFSAVGAVRWEPVVLNTTHGGVVYQVRSQVGVGRLVHHPMVDSPEYVLSGLACGERLRVWVRAFLNGGVSPWSAPVEVVLPRDTVPPPVPSVPVLSSRLGMVQVEWDGADSVSGMVWPADFRYCAVEAGGRVVDTVTLDRRVVVVGPFPDGEQVRVRLRSVDSSGNVSGWGAAGVVVVSGVSDDPRVKADIAEVGRKAAEARSAAAVAQSGVDTLVADFGVFRVLTADKLVIGHGGSILPNGAGELGDNRCWGPVSWLPDKAGSPEGCEGYFRYGGGTVVLPGPVVSVEPGRWYRCELWVRANKPGSVLYLELLSGREGVGRQFVFEPIEGAGAGDTPGRRVLSNVKPNEVWRRFVCRFRMADGADPCFRFGRVFYNHPSGVVTDAVVDIAGFRIIPVAGSTHIADGVVTTSKLAAGAVTADRVEATFQLNVGQRIVAGDPAGARAELSRNGLETYRQVEGNGVELAMQLGSGRDSFVLQNGGRIVASIDDEGQASFGSTSVKSLNVAGRDLSEWLSDVPRGVVAWREFRGGAAVRYSGGSDVLRFPVVLEDGRLYRLSADVKYVCQSAATFSVTMNGNLLAARFMKSAANAGLVSAVFSTGGERTLGLHVAPSGGWCDVWPQTTLLLEDLGKTVPMTGETIRPPGGGSTPPPPAPTRRFVSTWKATDSGCWAGVSYRHGKLRQGIVGFGAGDYHGQAVFMGGAVSGETGRTLADALAGAAVEKVEVWLYANHWYNNAGGTAIIRCDGGSAISGSAIGGSAVTVGGWPKPGGRWVDITSIAPNGGRGVRRVQVGKTGSSSRVYYGWFDGHQESSPPVLRVTYSR